MTFDPNDRAEIQELREKITELEFQLQAREQMDRWIKHVENTRNILDAELRELRPYAECYRRLQEAILQNPGTMEEWQRFCVMLKLVDPDIHKYTMR